MAGTFTHLCYHLIFSTKERRNFIYPEISIRLFEYIGGIINSSDGQSIIINGTSDHVHILCFVSKNIAISDFLKTIKSKSSKWVHETFPNHSIFCWQEGYGAFSVSDSQKETVINYIKNQQEHHKKISFKDEFVKILKQLKIPFNEEYLWK